MITEKKIAEIISRIVIGYQPDKIILFGSYAHGRPNNDSDLDLLIIKQTEQNPVERDKSVMKLLRGIKTSIDVMVYTREEFNKFKNVISSFEYQIAKNGKELWSKPELI